MPLNEQNEFIRKAAVVLISMGPRMSGEILKRLPEGLVERIAAEISSVSSVTPEERQRAFSELQDFRVKTAGVDRGGEDFAKEMLEQAVGTHRASTLMSRATGFGDATNFEMLKRVDPLTISNFLKAESPQTVAVVLAHIDPRHAGPILQRLPSSMQAEVAHKMAILGTPNNDFVRELEVTLANQVKGEYEQGGHQYGGKKQVADVLNEIDQEVWTEILEEMREIHDETAQDVKNLMFIFEDIITLEDRYIQEILKEIDSKELTVALKAATGEVKEKILGNMSKRAGQGIKEDMEYMGPVRLSDVEEAQQRIVDVIRRLEDEGTIVLGGGKSGDLVV